MKLTKRVGSMALGALFLLSGCGKVVQPNDEVYAPISETVIASSYDFHEISSAVTSVIDYGNYVVGPNQQSGTQKLYRVAADNKTEIIAEFEKGQTYKIGPLSPDSTKLFLYSQADGIDDASYYGVIVDLATGSKIVSSQPVFSLETVNWAGNDRIFMGFRQIRIFSASDFTEQTFRPEFLDKVEQDPDGKYIITGFIYDRGKDRYVLTYAEKKVGSTDSADDYKMALGIVLIDANGKTLKAFTPGEKYYSPYSSVDKAAKQILQIDSAGNLALFVAVMGDTDTPVTKALIVNVDRAEVAKTPSELRDACLRGGWIYGISFTPYQQWWETMELNVYKPNDSYKYTSTVKLFTEGNTFRYMTTAGTRSDLSYEVYLYPDGNVLLRSYNIEDGNTKILLAKITIADSKVTPIGVLPGNSEDMFKVAGIDNSGNIILLGSKTA